MYLACIWQHTFLSAFILITVLPVCSFNWSRATTEKAKEALKELLALTGCNKVVSDEVLQKVGAR